MASKVVGVSICQGQRLRLESPGGGGWGDPLLRPVEAVARDIRLGFVSAEAAIRDYGVRIAADGSVAR
jgi:N-methylhydantoinase B